MEREDIHLDVDTFTSLVYDESKEYKKVDEVVDYIDLGKGIKSCTLVVKRKSDNKFFRFEYNSDDENSLDIRGLANRFPMCGSEVFPEVITTTIYN